MLTIRITFTRGDPITQDTASFKRLSLNHPCVSTQTCTRGTELGIQYWS